MVAIVKDDDFLDTLRHHVRRFEDRRGRRPRGVAELERFVRKDSAPRAATSGLEEFFKGGPSPPRAKSLRGIID